MMSDLVDVAELLKAERKRLARKPKTPEQRDNDRLARRWWTDLTAAWTDAHLLSDDELQWLARVTDATRYRPPRFSRSGWNGRRVVIQQPTSIEDAVKLKNLRSAFSDREDAERRSIPTGRSSMKAREPVATVVSFGNRDRLRDLWRENRAAAACASRGDAS